MARTGILSLFGRGAQAASAAPALSPEAQALFNLKETALTNARRDAAAQGRPFYFTDYLEAAVQIPELRANPRVIADLSGHTLDGMTMRYEDLYPRTPEQAQQNLRGVIGIGAMRNIIDADGNGQIEVQEISNFYREVQANMRFHGTSFQNVTFQPATTLEIFNQQIASGAQFANITLNGLGKNETLTIGSGSDVRGANQRETFRNVSLINAEGGTIRVNRNALLDGLHMDGGRTVLQIAPGGQVNHLTVQGETVSLQIEEGGQLFLPRFEQATFTPSSSMRGAVLRGNNIDGSFYGFRDSNLNSMNFDGAEISGIDFERVDVSGASFRGARLSNVVIRDTDLTQVDFTGARIHNVTVIRGGVPQRANSLEELQGIIHDSGREAAINHARGIDISWHQHLAPAQPEQRTALHQTPGTTLDTLPVPAAALEVPPPLAGGDQVVNQPAEPARFQVASVTLNEQQEKGAQKPLTRDEVVAMTQAKIDSGDLTISRRS